MNIDSLITRFYTNPSVTPKIDVFDAANVYAAYQDIVRALMADADAELSVLQSFSYCFYELLDNVLAHSGKPCGTVVTASDTDTHRVSVLVADDGMGIAASLAQNPAYASIDEAEALRLCIQDKVTDGKGMGFGLYSTCRLVKSAGVQLLIHSGCSQLTFDGRDIVVAAAPQWQGTLVYLELKANETIDPNEVVENRTDCADQFNETFLGNEALDALWQSPQSVLRFATFGEYLGTRQLGATVHSQLIAAMETGCPVLLDFTGVKVVSNSFADECFGKLLLTMSLAELQRRTSFTGLDDLARKNIAVALRRRLATSPLNATNGENMTKVTD